MLASWTCATCKIDGTKRQAPPLITARTRRVELREIVTWRVYHRAVHEERLLAWGVKIVWDFFKLHVPRGPQERRPPVPPVTSTHVNAASFVENDAVKRLRSRCPTRVATVITELTRNEPFCAFSRIFSPAAKEDRRSVSGNDNRFYSALRYLLIERKEGPGDIKRRDYIFYKEKNR